MFASKPKVSLFLMTQKGFAVLEGLINNNLQASISKVVIGKDKNVIQDFSQDIQSLCEKYNIPYCYREYYIANFEDTYLIAISWRWLINADTKLIVLHDSILPKYRGFAPLVNMLINGETQIGVTALFAEDEYDKGPIIDQKITRIDYPITIATAIDTIAALYVAICISIFEKINAGQQLESKPQAEENASYSLWRDEKDYVINWHSDSSTICRFIDALGAPFSGAQCWVGGKKVIVQKAIEVEDKNIENRTVGKVIFMDNEGMPTIVCGKGLLKIVAAVFEQDSKSILPLKQFRIRFTSNDTI